MKTAIYFSRIALFAGALFLTSCRTEIDRSDRDSFAGISFTAGIAGTQTSETRTTGGGDKWVAGDAVGIFMLPSSADFPQSVYPNMGNKRYNVVNAATGELRPDSYPVIEYPRSGEAVDFVAYYPYSETNVDANGNYAVSLADQSDPAKIDVLVAKNRGAQQGAVNFQFDHALSKITLHLKLGEGEQNTFENQIASIEDVKLMSTPGSARVNLGDGTVTAGPNADISLLKAQTAATGYLATFSAIVFPNGDNGRYVKIVPGRQRPVIVWSIPADAFVAGKNHIFWGEIIDSELVVTESKITDWAQVDEGQAKPGNYAKIQQARRITWDSANGRYALTNDPTDGGLYFKFGSVVGVYSAHGKVQTLPVANENVNRDKFHAADDVVWDPTGSVTGDADAGWATIPCYTSDDHKLTPNTITPTVYHSAANVKAGKGDPCRLVGIDLAKIKSTDATSLKASDIDNGKWRLPTLEENKAFSGREVNGPFTSHWTELNGVKGGMFPNKNAGDATTFLPIVGYRNPDQGMIEGKNMYNNYWSSEPYDSTLGRALHFHDVDVSPQNQYSFAHGFFVRCVRQ